MINKTYSEPLAAPKSVGEKDDEPFNKEDNGWDVWLEDLWIHNSSKELWKKFLEKFLLV